ncbi:MAG TPA: bacillithiol biosynthesis cysteine-adding enzyme BshC [Bacteroidia bacterium]|nr:bacillithiol biosynthesis cysteine-adding enzyme BshC [Bacteroidia bacterium]
MNKTSISYERSGSFSGLFLDYLSGNEKVRPFYSYLPVRESFKTAAEEKHYPRQQRSVLTTALINQYQQQAPEYLTEVQPVIAALGNENTFTVTTGHQLNLFTGPLYSIYKIATTIKLASELAEKYPHRKFVPVFWMASEDHDFEEIKSVQLTEKKLAWNPGFPPVACGAIPTDRMHAFIEELQNAAGNSALFREMASCYTSGSNLAQATRKLVHLLFAGSNLLVIDGNDASLKNLFVEEMLDDVFNHSAYTLVSETAERLGKNYKVQVTPREINLFYLEPDYRGRIIKSEQGRYEVSGSQKVFTAGELETEIKTHPGRFSPNVVLRPLYQEKILPNLAYIGGPGEIAYWLELRSTFEHYTVPFPVLMPRNSFMILDEQVIRKMKKAEVNTEDLFLGREALLKKVIKGIDAIEEAFNNLKSEMGDAFKTVSPVVAAVDPTLSASLEAEEQKVRKGIDHFTEKLFRAVRRKEEVTVSQVDWILNRLFPDGALQERSLNILAIAGDKTFIPQITDWCDPFSFTFDIITLQP